MPNILAFIICLVVDLAFLGLGAHVALRIDGVLRPILIAINAYMAFELHKMLFRRLTRKREK